MRCRAIPYEGNEPFLFLSYCHADEKMISPIFEQMAAAGYRIWYDEGNNAGDDWAENIAQHLSSSAAVVAFLTPNAVASPACNRELNFSVAHDRKVIPIMMEPLTLSGAMELMLSCIHFLKRLDFSTDAALIEKIGHSDGIDVCLDKSGALKLREITDEELIDNDQPDVIDKEDDSFKRGLVDNLNRAKSDSLNKDSHKQNIDPIIDVIKPDEVVLDIPKTKENTEEKKADPDEWYDTDDIDTIYTSPLQKQKNNDDTDDNEETQKARNVDQILLLLPSSGTSYITSELEVIMGRSKAKSHFIIENIPTIGRAHASIIHSDNKYCLRDLDSKNGTYYQDKELKDGKVIELCASDIFQLHHEPVVFVSGKTVVQATATGRIAVVISRQKTGVQTLATGSLPLNRYHKWADGTMQDTRVHRKGHARLEMKYDGCYLIEEGPKPPEPNNGTFLNEQRLNLGEARKLNNGDIIRLGDTELEFMLFEIKGAK